jgi:signal transduction histidine kinase
VNVSVEETVAVPEDVKIALYRVAQEAFSNIAKYARARRVTASLKADAAGAVLRVADDGRGFAPTSVTPERMGLRIMRERLDQIGASLDVDSAPGRGTTVVVTWRRDADDRPEIGEEGGREQLEAHSSDDRG